MEILNYLIAILAGAAVGVIAGGVKYIALWRPLLKNKRKFSTKTIAISQVSSMLISVAVLLAIYFLRDIWPYSFFVTILSAAVVMSFMSRFSPLRDVKKMEALEKQAKLN